MNKIYLDNNSTTQLDPRILKKMIPFFSEKFGNSSSRTHSFGWEADAAIEQSRKEIAALINAEKSEIIFTSGATESNNIIILNHNSKDNHIITMSIEHKAVLDICKEVEKNNTHITYLNPKKNGLIKIEKIADNIHPKTTLVSIMHANNEIGVIQPIYEIGKICKSNNISFHVDGAQSLGKTNIDVKKMNIDFLSLSAHKIYGPKGIGCLYINKKHFHKLKPRFYGGSQERSLRPGTLPVPLIVGFGEACKILNKEQEKESNEILKKRKLLIQKIKTEIPDVIVNGDKVNRIPGNVNFSFPSLKGQSIINSMPSIAISGGSACTSSSPKPSHVLKNIGLNKQLINSAIRICIGRFNTYEHIEIAAETIIKTVKQKSSY